MDYSFQKVLTMRRGLINFLMIFVGLFSVGVYLCYFGAEFNYLLVTLMVGLDIALAILFLYFMAKPLNVSFGENHIVFSVGGKKRLIKKSDIAGFYSYDYSTKAEQLARSTISFDFVLKDQANFYLTDWEFPTKFDPEKAKYLKGFQKELNSELGFKICDGGKAKSAWNSKCWFSQCH